MVLSALITVFISLLQLLDAQHTKWMMAAKLDGEFTFQNTFNIAYCGENRPAFGR